MTDSTDSTRHFSRINIDTMRRTAFGALSFPRPENRWRGQSPAARGAGRGQERATDLERFASTNSGHAYYTPPATDRECAASKIGACCRIYIIGFDRLRTATRLFFFSTRHNNAFYCIWTTSRKTVTIDGFWFCYYTSVQYVYYYDVCPTDSRDRLASRKRCIIVNDE